MLHCKNKNKLVKSLRACTILEINQNSIFLSNMMGCAGVRVVTSTD